MRLALPLQLEEAAKQRQRPARPSVRAQTCWTAASRSAQRNLSHTETNGGGAVTVVARSEIRLQQQRARAVHTAASGALCQSAATIAMRVVRLQRRSATNGGTRHALQACNGPDRSQPIDTATPAQVRGDQPATPQLVAVCMVMKLRGKADQKPTIKN